MAGKVNDEPRGLDGLIQVMLRQWFSRDNPDLRARVRDPEFLISLRQRAEEAEFALMLALGFDFNVELLIPTCARLVKRVDSLAMLRGYFNFQQFMVAACNDIMQRDPMLVLQYDPVDIAAGVIQLYFKVARQQKLKIDQPALHPDGSPWYLLEGLSAETQADIEARFLAKVYVQVGPKGGVAPHAGHAGGPAGSTETATATTMPAGSDVTEAVGGAGWSAQQAAALSSHQHAHANLGVNPEKLRPMSQATVEHAIPVLQCPREHVFGSKRPRPGHEPAASGSTAVGGGWLDPSISHVGFQKPSNLPAPTAPAPEKISTFVSQQPQRPGPAPGGFATNYNPSLIRRQAFDRTLETGSIAGHPCASLAQLSTLRGEAGFPTAGPQPCGLVGAEEDSEPEEGEIEEGEIL